MNEEQIRYRALLMLEELGRKKQDIPVEHRIGYMAALFDVLCEVRLKNWFNPESKA